jgi:hypothetical protein
MLLNRIVHKHKITTPPHVLKDYIHAGFDFPTENVRLHFELRVEEDLNKSWFVTYQVRGIKTKKIKSSVEYWLLNHILQQIQHV